jgi:hypothetical protein
MIFKYVVVHPFSHNGKKYKKGDHIFHQGEAASLHERHRHKRTVKVVMTPEEEAKWGASAQAEPVEPAAE